MKKTSRMIGVLAGLLLISLACGQASAETWVSDPVGTWMEFGFNHSGLYDVTVTASHVMATVELDGEDLTEAKFVISAAANTFWSHNSLFSWMLKTDKFFDIENCPNDCGAPSNITFESEKIVKEGTAYRVDGALSAHGVTRPISLTMTPGSRIWEFEGTTFRAFTLKGIFKRDEYGLGHTDEFENWGSNEWTIKFTVEVTDKPFASGFTPPQTYK
jgi:polyisoprenoid-binding protein YceI